MALRRCHLAIVLLLAAVAHQACAQDKSIVFTELPQDVFEATSSLGRIPNYVISATYARDNTSITLDCTVPPTNQFPLGRTPVRCFGEIEVPNPADPGKTKVIGGFKRFNITIVDTAKPILSVPVNIVVPASGPLTDVPFSVTARDVDDVDVAPSIFCSSSRGDNYPSPNANLSATATGLPVSAAAGSGGPTTVSCFAVDDSNNRADNRTFTITVVDNVPPVIDSNVTVNSTDGKRTIIREAEGPGGTKLTDLITLANITATDNTVVGNLPLTSTGIPANDLYPLGSTDVVFRATDPSGNTATLTITVIIQDTIAPVIAQPANIRVNATDANGTLITFNIPTATDAVTTSPVVTCNATSGTVFPITLPVTTTIVECNSADAAGNRAIPVTFTITVVDEVPPVMPSNGLTLFVDDESGNVTFPGFTNPNAIDNVDGLIPISCDIEVGDKLAFVAPNITYLANCTVTDKHGNKAEAQYPVIVKEPVTQLTIIVPNDILDQEADDAAGKKIPFSVSAIDVIDPAAVGVIRSPRPLEIVCVTSGTGSTGTLTLTANATSSSKNATSALSVFSDAQFNIQNTTVTCTVTNYLGKTATDSFLVEVQDTTAPVVTITNPTGPTNPAPATPGGTTVPYTCTAIDSVAGSLPCDCKPIAPGGKFPKGETPVNCTATDPKGNTGSATTIIYVADKEAPKIDPVGPIIRDVSGSPTLNVTYPIPGCTDDLDGNLTVTCTPASGSSFPIGVTSYTCICTDSSNNTATTTSTITVNDVCTPTMSVPINVTEEATSPAGAVAVFNVTAQDCTPTPLPVTCTPASGSVFPYNPLSKPTKTDVTCTATYPGNNRTVTQTFPVFIQDTQPPVIDNVANINVQAGPSGEIAVEYATPNATDVVDPQPDVVCVPPSNSTFKVGNNTVTCTATDDSGNSASKDFLVIVTLAPPPKLTCPSSVVKEAIVKDGKYFAEVSYSLSSQGNVTCAIDGRPVSSPVKVFLNNNFQPNTVKVVCTLVSDPRATCDFNITVQDKTPCRLCGKKDMHYHACGPHGVDICEGSVAFTTGSDNLSPRHFKAPCNWPNRNCRKGSCRFGLGTTVITCSAVDSAGNNCTTSFKVVVKDKVPPHISVCPTTLEATSPAGARLPSLRERVFDNVDGILTPSAITYRLVSNNQTITFPYTFPLGTTRVIIRAVDRSGNAAQVTTFVKVVDTTCPRVIVKDRVITRTATDKFGVTIASFAGQCTGTDAVTPAAQLRIAYRPVGKFPIGATWVQCSVTDLAGNTGLAGFFVHVEAPRDTCNNLQIHVANAPPHPWMITEVRNLCGFVLREERLRACGLCNKVIGGFRPGTFGRILADRLHAQLRCIGARPFKRL